MLPALVLLCEVLSDTSPAICFYFADADPPRRSHRHLDYYEQLYFYNKLIEHTWSHSRIQCEL